MPRESDTAAVERRSRAGLVIGLIALAALLLFIFQNTDDAQVDFLWFSGEIPLFMLLFITVGLTLIIAVAAAWLLGRRNKND